MPEPAGNEAPEKQPGYGRSERPNKNVQKSYTKFQQDAQCYWAEGEKRLVTRDQGYEAVLVDELKKRAKPETEADQRNWGKDEKFIKFEDMAAAERPQGEVDYKVQESKPSYTIWNGIWIGWYGMDTIERYVDYMLDNGQTWELGVDIMEIAEDLEDIRGRRSFGAVRKHRRPEAKAEQKAKDEAAVMEQTRQMHGLSPQPAMASYKAALLKKKALVDIAPSPTVLPPRDDIKDHLDEQFKDQQTKELMQGIREPLNPKKKKRRPQINPNINPLGVAASEKTADYSQQDWEQDEASEAWLDQVRDAEDEAKRHFMQEDYIQQIAQDDGVSMDELWKDMGDEYTAEFYGVPYKRVPDYTDAPAEEWKGSQSSEEEIEKYLDKGQVFVEFRGQRQEFDDVVVALDRAKSISQEHPGEPAVFIIDESGVVTEDTFINGQQVGETVEKFGFQAIK